MLPLTTIDRYVVRSVTATFVPVLLGTTTVFLLGGALRLLQVEDVSLGQVALALPWFVPSVLPFVVPLSYQVSLSLVFGRMAAEGELGALEALGIPNRALLAPALLPAAALALLLAALTASVIPHCYQHRREVMRTALYQVLDLGEGKHWSRILDPGFDVYARRHAGRRLEGVVLHRDLSRDGGQGSAQVVARVGEVREETGGGRLVLALEDVTVTVGGHAPGQGPLRMHVERLSLGIGLSGWTRVKPAEYATSDLRSLTDEGPRTGLAAAVGGLTGARVARDTPSLPFRLELFERAALSAAPLALALLTLPLSLLLGARNPLVHVFVGLLGACGAFYVPTLLGHSLGAALEEPRLVLLGCATACAVAATCAAASRRG